MNGDYGEGIEERVESREREYTYTYIRVRTPTNRKLTLYIPETSRLLIDNARGVLRREGKSISNFLVEQLEAYYRLHEPGNPQQRLDTILKLGKAYHAPCRICGFKDCLRDSVAVGLFKPNMTEYALCKLHYAEAGMSSGLWQILVEPKRETLK